MTPAAVLNMVRRMLREEGWARPATVVTIGPDCQPMLLEDAE